MFKSVIYVDCPLVVQKWNGYDWEDLSGWGRFNNVEDLYTCLGNLLNKSEVMLNVSMLAYYDKEFDDIIVYKQRIINSLDNCCCILTNSKMGLMYRIMYQEV